MAPESPAGPSGSSGGPSTPETSAASVKRWGRRMVTAVPPALGSLLILWLMIELLDAEIDRLQGGDFRFNLFVGVGLVASLTRTDLKTELMYLGGILILGVIFWLVTKAEAKKS